MAVLLSAQATDKSVNLATRDLFEIVDNPKAMLNLGEVELKKYIKTIGLYNSKAKFLRHWYTTGDNACGYCTPAAAA